MSRYAISNTQGQWWSCSNGWTVEQARDEFADLESLPEYVDEAALWVHSTPANGCLDARYYLPQGEDEAVAAVEEI